MGAKHQPCYNRIRAVNDHVIMRLQCISNNNGGSPPPTDSFLFYVVRTTGVIRKTEKDVQKIILKISIF